jgi:hypothetical protein
MVDERVIGRKVDEARKDRDKQLRMLRKKFSLEGDDGNRSTRNCSSKSVSE